MINDEFISSYPIVAILIKHGKEQESLVICYNKLWKLLIDRGIKKTGLIRLAGVSTNVIARMSKNRPVAMESLVKICTALQCDIADIVEFMQPNV